MQPTQPIALVAAALLVLPGATLAQEAAQEAAPEHRAAASELLQVTEMERFMSESTSAMIDIQIDANPELAQFEGVLREFFNRHLRWENLEPEFVDLYVRHFTAGELRDLADFYRTDLGKKAISLQGVLFTEGSQIGQRIVQENLGELQQMVMQRAQEIQSQGAPKP